MTCSHGLECGPNGGKMDVYVLLRAMSRKSRELGGIRATECRSSYIVTDIGTLVNGDFQVRFNPESPMAWGVMHCGKTRILCRERRPT